MYYSLARRYTTDSVTSNYTNSPSNSYNSDSEIKLTSLLSLSTSLVKDTVVLSKSK